MIGLIWVPALWATAGGYDGQVTAWVTLRLFALLWGVFLPASKNLIRAFRNS